MGCDVDDPAELLTSAELALDRARRFGDVNLETKALADAGLAHVQAGRVAAGMTLLDEAMALACGPADDVDTAIRSVCSFFTACYHAADFERFGSWADLLRRHGLISHAPGGPVFISGHCDSVQAALLVEQGRWGEAEDVLTRAKAVFESVMHLPSWHPDIALAELRVRQGRLTDGEVLLLGKDQAMQALLPAARRHAGGDRRRAGRQPAPVAARRPAARPRPPARAHRRPGRRHHRGQGRRAASAAERARLNVTRALRAAIARLVEAMPGAGEVLDRRVRTALYCVYAPDDGDEVRWIVQS